MNLEQENEALQQENEELRIDNSRLEKELKLLKLENQALIENLFKDMFFENTYKSLMNLKKKLYEMCYFTDFQREKLAFWLKQNRVHYSDIIFSMDEKGNHCVKTKDGRLILKYD